jgi:hypothetical protein
MTLNIRLLIAQERQMMQTSFQDVFDSSLVEALAKWVTDDGELCSLRRLDGVPENHVTKLRLQLLNQLALIDVQRNADNKPRFNMRVETLIKKSAASSEPGEVSSDQATEIRNSVENVYSKRSNDPLVEGLGMLLLTTPSSGDFSSVGDGVFKVIGYHEALRLAAKLMIETFDLSKYFDVLSLCRSYEWAESHQDSSEHSEGHAMLFAIAASGGEIGPELWRIGLIPDLGVIDLADRLRVNRKVVAKLIAPVGKRDLTGQLLAAGVKMTPATSAVAHLLGTQNLSFKIEWCRKLLLENKGQLTFDKWSFDDSAAAQLDALSILPFRDVNGAVVLGSKLKQEGGKSHSDPIFTEVEFNADGEAKKPPTVVLQWDTDPPKTSAVSRWDVSLVIPKAFREEDQEPLIVKSLSGDKRKNNFRIELNREDLPDGVGESGLLVCFEVAAFDEDGAPVCFSSTGEEVSKESQEFELRFGKTIGEIESKPRRDGSVSPAEAKLAASVEADLPEYVESFGFKDSAKVLDIDFVEIGGRSRVLQTRSIRTVPNLIEIQKRLIAESTEPLVAHFVGRAGKRLSLSVVRYEELSLPESLVHSRREFLDEVKTACLSRGCALVEVALWTVELSEKLDRYIEEFKSCLESSGKDQREALLRMDSFEIQLEDRNGMTTSTVIMPTHPLRAAWIREYTLQLNQMADAVMQYPLDERASQVDLKLIRRISASNLPFMLGLKSGALAVYGEEIAFGYGFYTSPLNADYDVVMSMVMEVIDAERSASFEEVRIANLGRVVDRFLESKKNSDVLSLMTLNAGDGHLMASVLSRFFQDETDDSDAFASYRLMIQCYADRFPFSDPVRSLHELQVARSGAIRPGLSHLAPPIGVSVRSRKLLTEDTENVHLAVALGVASGEFASHKLRYSRRAHMNGVVTGSQTERGTESEKWFTTAHLGGIKRSALTDLHNIFLQSAQSGDTKKTDSLGIIVELTADTRFELRSLHDRADRVITIDRFVGLDWYEEAQSLGLGATYILDYTPDFVEGLSDRLIVTTRYRDEMMRVIGSAMDEMGLSVLGSETAVINNLGLISGRLAMNLLSNNPQAHEAVGLAVVMSFLRAEGKLDGWVVIPVDSHLEIFGADAQNKIGNGRRCDILLVRFVEKCLEIRCVEVKERQGGNISNKLIERIAEQLNNTVDVLTDRFLQTSDVRIDRPVQIAHFSSILHHYIDKAQVQGLINSDQWLNYHEGADDLEGGCYELTREGYVVALQGASQEIQSYDGIPIQIITESDLAGTPFTTYADEQTRSVVSVEKGTMTDVHEDEEQILEYEAPIMNVQQKSPVGENFEKTISSKSDESTGNRGSSSLSVETKSMRERGVSKDVKEDYESKTVTDSYPNSAKSDSNKVMEKTLTRVYPSNVSVELGRDLANQQVNWEVSTQGSPHAFILGITGQGKSVTTRHIVDSFASQGLPSIILDLHGDMAANPPSGSKVVDARANGLGFSPFQLSGHLPADINDSAFEIAEIVGYVCDLGEIQTMHVYRGMNQAYKDLGWVNGAKGTRLPTISEFADAVEAVESGAKGKNARERLMPFTDFGLFRDDDDQAFDPTGGGKGLVIDLHGYKNEKVLRAASSFILRKIYREMFLWAQDSTLKIAVVIDEAHRFAKDKTLPKLMKEGRKYGVSCLVASQNISDFDKEVSGNSGTKIVFRTNFPESKKVAETVRGAGKNDLSKLIEQLNVGEAFVATPGQPIARKTRMIGDVK